MYSVHFVSCAVKEFLFQALNRGCYTLASDVWSFGVLLWEVFSGGAQPYTGMSGVETKEKVIITTYSVENG